MKIRVICGEILPLREKIRADPRLRSISVISVPINNTMFHNYFATTLRHLAKNKVSSGINLLGLTLGITACLAIALITHYELSYDRFHPDTDRIYRVVAQSKFGKTDAFVPMGFIPRAAPQAIREEVTGLETVAAFHNIESDVIIPDGTPAGKKFAGRNMQTERAQIIVTEPQYFTIFPYEWLAGNPQTALNDPNKVVLTEAKARLYFGDLPLSDMLGREVIYRDSVRTQVSGIVRAWSGNTDFTFTDFISQATINASVLKEEINLHEWNDMWSASQTFVKLDKSNARAQVDAQLKAFSTQHFGPDHGTNDMIVVPSLQPLSDLHFNFDYQDNYTRKAHLPTLYGLLGVAAFILLIATINFINMATARSVERAREVGMRKVLGGSRQSLVLQFMSETLVLTVLAAGAALLITPVIFRQFSSFVPAGFVFSGSDPKIALFLGSITVLTTLLAGFYPSWILSAYQPATALKGQAGFQRNEKGYLRKGLIVFQFTVSLLFIISTIVVSSQLNFMRNKDLGFKSAAVVTLNAPHGPAKQLSVLLPQIRQLAGVQNTTLQIFEPMGQNFGLDRVVYKGKTIQEFDAAYKMGDENFIPFYDMKLLAGRNYLKSDTACEFVLTENFVKAMGFQNPADVLGQQLQWHDKYYPVVGVVADFHQLSMHEKMPITFLTTAQHTGSMAVKLRPGTPQEAQATLAQIGQLWAAVYPDHKFEYHFLDDTIAEFYEKEQKTARLVNLATFIAIMLSCMGLFGLIVFMAEQRRKEIGIRKVLGASVAGITALLAIDFLKLVLLAIIIASPIAAYFLQQWLADFAYRIELQGWMFALAGVAAILISFLTVGVQGVKAALANPVESLRSE